MAHDENEWFDKPPTIENLNEIMDEMTSHPSWQKSTRLSIPMNEITEADLKALGIIPEGMEILKIEFDPHHMQQNIHLSAPVQEIKMNMKFQFDTKETGYSEVPDTHYKAKIEHDYTSQD